MLRQKAISGVKWNSVASVITALLQILQLVILSRFLSLADFGLMSISLIVLGFSQLFIDLGFSGAIIHKDEISHIQLSTLYWLNVLVGLIGFVILFAAAPAISSFYNESRLTGIVRMLALTFIILPFGQQHEVLLRKSFYYKSLAIRDISVKLFSLLVSVLLAYIGFGVYALVFSQLVSAIITTVFLIQLGHKIHKPGFVWNINSIKNDGFISFSVYQTGERIINYFNAQFDVLIIGKLLGVDKLGLYTVAKNIALRPVLLINPSIVNVAVSLLSRIKNDKALLKDTYLKIVKNITLLNVYVYAFVFFFSREIISTFLGTQWLEASFCLKALSISGLVISIGNPVGALQVACGRPDKGFYWNLILLFIIPATVLAGTKWGIDGVSFLLACLRVILLFIGWVWFVHSLLKVKFFEFHGILLKMIFCAFVNAGILKILFDFINILNNWVLIIAGAIYTCIFCICLFLMDRGIVVDIKNIFRDEKSMFD